MIDRNYSNINDYRLLLISLNVEVLFEWVVIYINDKYYIEPSIDNHFDSNIVDNILETDFFILFLIIIQLTKYNFIKIINEFKFISKSYY